MQRFKIPKHIYVEGGGCPYLTIIACIETVGHRSQRIAAALDLNGVAHAFSIKLYSH